MGKFFTRLFAVIGFITIVTILIIAIGVQRFIDHTSKPTKTPDTIVLALDFIHPIVEHPHAISLSLDYLLHDDETQLTDIIRALDHAKTDSRVKGIVARFGSNPPSLVQAQEIRAALQRFKDIGKFSYAYAANYGDFGQGNRAYYMASAFENIWLQPVGTVSLTGLAMESPFAKTALGNVGVTTDFMRREEYKSVMENVTGDAYTPPVKAMMEAMLKNLADQEIKGIADNRKMDPKTVSTLMAQGPYTSNEALKAGLVTHIGYADDMLDEAQKKAGADAELVHVEDYLDMEQATPAPKATIALINGIGMIVDDPETGSHLNHDDVIDADSLSSAFYDASHDTNVKAILFRVNSPGGSPSASETIRHALVKAKESKKPVFVSMGDVAASGGYWISMNADHIVAEPATLTGSIGVVAGKFVLGGLWQKLGVKWDSITTNDNAQMWSTLNAFTPHDRDRMNALLDDTYHSFIENVSAARKIPLEKMPELAKGRVWTGDQAVKIGLVDELGGIETTIQALKKQLNLAPNDPIAIQQFPAPETPELMAMKLLKNFGIESAMLQKTVVGLQKIQSIVSPVTESMDDTGMLSSKVPASVLRIPQ